MALAVIKRLAFIPFAASVAFSLGCSSKSDDDSSSSGCTKDTDCIDGRICESGTCKDPGGVLGSGGTTGGTGGTTGGTTSDTGGSSSASGGTSNGTGGSGAKGGTSNGTGGSGAKGGTGGTSNGTGGTPNGTGGTGGTGGTTGGTGGSGGSAGAAGSSAGTGGACTDTDPYVCEGTDSVSVCIQGSYETFTCDYYCSTLGFTTGPCTTDDTGSGCACPDVLDSACANGVGAYCACISDSDMPCTDYDKLVYYVQCYQNDPSTQEDTDFLKCLGMQVTTDSSGMSGIDCQAAGTACGATPAGTGGAGGMSSGGGMAGKGAGGSAGATP